MTRILVADDHAVVRRGILSILEDHPDLELAGEASDAGEVLERIRGASWDLLLLDLSMPGLSGLDLLKQVRSHRPELPVLILSVHPEEQFGARVLKAGASGYVHKDAPPEQLVTAMRRVLRGQKYVSPALASRLAEGLGGDTEDPHELLSDREFQVLRLMGAGRTVSEIADDLSLSVKTVSTYRSRLLDKLRLDTTAELIRYAIENDLVE